VGRTIVREGELLRHTVYSRALHWGVAVFFVLALLSGFALYTPWLFRWLTPLFGGGSLTRVLHPWFSLAFVALFAAQCVNWWRPMSWTRADSQWLRHIRRYIANTQTVEPDYVDFFNGGQKAYFWAIVVSAVVFVVSGIPLWFPATFGRSAAAVAYVFHDVAALVMLVGFIVHIYEASAAQPGTFRSMMRGTVDERWAWTHHPAWYRRATGRDPKADYEAAVQRQAAAARESRAS
jgi:formate dehydrogenase subunit gamma